MRSPDKPKEASIEETVKIRRQLKELRDTCECLEAALKTSQKKFSAVFMKSMIPMAITTVKEGMYIDVNESFSKTMGLTREELIGNTSRGIGYVTAEQREVFLSEIRTKGCVENLELSVRTKGREVRHGLFNAVKIKIDDKDCLLTMVTDVTEKKRIEDALRESEEKYRILIEKANEAINIVQDGVLVFANPRMSDLVGLPAKDLTDRRFIDFVWPEDRQWVEDRQRKRAAGEDIRDAYDFRFIGAGGKLSWVFLSATKIQWEGKPATLNLITDITDRKRVEEELRATRQRLIDIIEFLPDATFVIDEEKKVVAWNLACEEMTGVRKEEIIGKGDYVYSIPFYGERRPLLIDYVTMDSDELQKKYMPVKRMGHLLYAEARAPMLYGGKGAFLSGKASTLFDRQGRAVGAIESIRDITDVKDLEAELRQAQKMESVGTLAGGIAHDFNNILTSLMGYASLLQIKLEKNNPLQGYVDQILSASRKAADLTQSLLTFSRKKPVSLVPLDMNETIGVAKKLLRRLLREDIELSTSLMSRDAVVMADKSQIDQILFNLATNARDAMPKGGTLTIETDTVTIDSAFIDTHGFGELGRYVLITISDTGMGMDEATKEKIFDPFFTTKETGKGTGLGLATVYGIVRQHNGFITVDSELGGGTAFRIYLPAAGVTADEKELKPAPISRGSEKILIAEDNDDVRLFMREALVCHGYKTIEAVDGEDALAKFSRHRDIDLVIVDSVMPKKNGREVYEVIHGTDPHVRVLFSSGYTKDIVLDKGIEDKEFDFIAKPLSLEKFLQKVREMLDR